MTATVPVLTADAASALVATVAEIKVEHEAAQRCASEAVAHAIRCGELLLRAKAALSHGEFGPWLAANVAFSERTAQAYMRLARLDPERRNSVALLSLRQALMSIADIRRLDVLGAPPNRTVDEGCERPAGTGLPQAQPQSTITTEATAASVEQVIRVRIVECTNLILAADSTPRTRASNLAELLYGIHQLLEDPSADLYLLSDAVVDAAEEAYAVYEHAPAPTGALQ